jgi:hypothetical protein
MANLPVLAALAADTLEHIVKTTGPAQTHVVHQDLLALLYICLRSNSNKLKIHVLVMLASLAPRTLLSLLPMDVHRENVCVNTLGAARVLHVVAEALRLRLMRH